MQRLRSKQGGFIWPGILIAVAAGYILGYAVVAGEKYEGQAAHAYRECTAAICGK